MRGATACYSELGETTRRSLPVGGLALCFIAAVANASTKFGEALFNGADPDANVYNGVRYVYSNGVPLP